METYLLAIYLLRFDTGIYASRFDKIVVPGASILYFVLFLLSDGTGSWFL